MAANKQGTRLLVSYLTLRRLIGVFGVTLPIVLMFGCWMLGDPHWLKDSISAYYKSAMGDAFVGVMFATGTFLFAYKGYDITDDRAGDIACVGCLGVALFPATSQHWTIQAVHYASAFVLFAILSCFALILFRKTAPGGTMTHEKRIRNALYRGCGYVMVGCIIAIGAIKLTALEEVLSAAKPVFWLETMLLWAFGISWFVKGDALRLLGLQEDDA